ncbi:apoptosis inhibitor 5-like protein API5 isoform X1 [Histomonas meleagridis]|uniref:apoptosis inhibitor 5-like protein API5 isoform X1 n=1 Tax=Histomonas meleagridis TaxID=135588 RepID=UPI003559EF7F|nr:apoptosis inhibitor 5-like protein API5 isoform X1 [Histomonas meleagridis]KAH0796467.1 apoptosis inhibitor 5-like protein API5 isoform X1 [Histomonas meleagridis]
MPPKGKAVNVTANMLIDCNEKMGGTDSPAENDFKLLLAGASAKSDIQVRRLSAQLIPRFAEKFPKQINVAVSSMVELSKDDDDNVRLTAIKGIVKFYNDDKAAVISVLLNALGDTNEKIVEFVEPVVIERLETDEEFKSIFSKSLSKLKPESQCKMVGYIRDKIKFTEETVPELLEVIQIALKSCVVEGLRLYGKNKKLISEEQSQPLIDELLELLDNSLESNFDEVVNNLMVQILHFTRTIGNYSTTKLLNILTKRVMPKYESLPIEVKIAVIQKIADVARDVEGEELINEVYNRVFLKLPKSTDEAVNFTLAEATLFAFYRLAQKFSSAASKLIGTVLVRTGQPDEADDVNEDQEKQNEFRERLENLLQLAVAFGDQYGIRFNEIRSRKTTNEEESEQKRKDMKNCIRAQKTGANINKICHLLLGTNPLTTKFKARPSWVKKNVKKFTRPYNGRRESNRNNYNNYNRNNGNRNNYNTYNGNNRNNNYNNRNNGGRNNFRFRTNRNVQRNYRERRN